MPDTAADGATCAIGAAAEAGGTSDVADVGVHDLVDDPGIGKSWHYVNSIYLCRPAPPPHSSEWNEEDII